MSKKIVLFASGSGTNAENIIRYFQRSAVAEVVGVYTNKVGAGVIARAEKLGVPVRIFDRNTFNETTAIQDEVKGLSVDLVVLAGFLWKIPDAFIRDFPGKIVNIHPALLPKFGGKGMYGMHVHRAVLEAGESKSGITIHLVNEKYDEGQIIFQKDLPIRDDDTPETLASRIHELEYNHYPAVIEKLLKS